jgi:4-oxalocrotonate tautomerase family enzyme
MPFIRISTFGPALTADQISNLQQGVTELMTGVMRKPKLSVAVLVEQVTLGGWSIAGKQVSKAAQVECHIGGGTNTPEEKAEFMSSVVKLLQSTIGLDVPDVSYTMVHEHSHDSYGRGGLSRHLRENPRRAV